MEELILFLRSGNIKFFTKAHLISNGLLCCFEFNLGFEGFGIEILSCPVKAKQVCQKNSISKSFRKKFSIVDSKNISGNYSSADCLPRNLNPSHESLP
jgi:hypothetical protein